MSPIRLVTLDVTNTIIRVLGNVGQNYAKIAAIYNIHVEPARLEHYFKSVYKKYTDTYPNFGVRDGMTSAKWWNDVVIESFARSGCDVTQIEPVARHLYLHFSTKQGWEIIPNTEQALIKLKQSGVKLGVVSNFDERLEKILKELALRHYFDFAIASSTVKIAKPEVGIFQMALDAAEVRAEEAVHVGDNVVNDYLGARQAGLESLLLWKKDKDLPENVDKSHMIYGLEDVLKVAHIEQS